METPTEKLKVVIAGGGTAGWLAAAALTRQLAGFLDITLIESEEIGTVGVGESTIPPMKTFHRMLRIDEQEFMKATHATFKLGIQFENWKTEGDRYFHSFGTVGKGTLITEFIHFWLRGRELGIASDFGDYCLEYKAALEGRCSIYCEQKINHAFHLDSGLYAGFLRAIAEPYGMKREEGKIVQVAQDPTTGFITSIKLDSGKEVNGDFFIDCTGFRGLLIEHTLHAGYEDWSHWLPCDKAVVVQTESVGPAMPYTRVVAHKAGWRWRIPLQHRVGNGVVYCNRYMSDDEATSKLLADVEGRPITEPRIIPFRAGKRRKNWSKNCVAIGLASGFLEPLESTSIHLVMTALTRILQLFPQQNIPASAIEEYNNQAASEIEKIRDFIILHYKLTERDDSPFWRHCKNMEIPESLSHRIKLFKEIGRSFQTEGELFRLDSWTQVMMGQGLYPEQYHPIVNTMNPTDLRQLLMGLQKNVAGMVDQMPSHDDFVRRYCGI